MTPATERLIIFTRYPRAGKAKTRMIPLLGRRGAADLARRMIEHTLSWAGQLSFRRQVDVELCYEGADDRLMKKAFGREWGRLRYRRQATGYLGAKMGQAFLSAFEEGARSAVIVGTDIPGLTDGIVGRAFDLLKGGVGPPWRRDLVLGPSRDGGYYLIGLTSRVLPRQIDGLLSGVPWGTGAVLEVTEKLAETSGLSYVLLDVLDDVDLPSDLTVWRRALKRKQAAVSLESISVVIPALNEESTIARTIESARQVDRDIEIIVVDGGSADTTRTVAAASGAAVIESRPPRSRQMNTGAGAARGDVLLFLHADTLVPASYDRYIVQALSRPGVIAGAFELGIGGKGVPLRLVEYMANARSHLFQMPYGDQGLFMRASLFCEIGGFEEIPIMDDFELVRRLKKRGTVAVAPVSVVTSGRRWRAMGVTKTTLVNQAVIAAYLLGVSPGRIARWYRREKGIGHELPHAE